MQSSPIPNYLTPPKAGCAIASRRHLLLIVGCLLLIGCSKPGESGGQGKPTVRPLEGLTLRLAVVDDPAMAAAIVRLRGEWNAQTGAELQIDETTEKDLLEAGALPADAVVCASHLLGVLADRQWLKPVPPRIERDADWGGAFELLRLREASWGNQIMAVPFGSPIFCCYYRADLLEKLKRRPPQSWAEYQELAKLLAQTSRPSTDEAQDAKASWCGTIEPLAPGWAGLVLLARAAPYAKHRDNYSTLFDLDTMQPLVSSQPFVQALEELVAAARVGPSDPLSYNPAAARAAFWQGECGMTLTWPTAASEVGKGSIPKNVDPQIRAGFVELPGSRRVFNIDQREWDNRAEDDDTRVPLLAIAGRLGVVGAKAANTDAAFQLLLWLSDDRLSPQVSAKSPATTLFRQSNLKSPGQWVEKPVGATAAVQYGDATEAAFRHEQWLGALRLPGRAEYLAALDEAVASAVRGEKTPVDALIQAEAQWRTITERLGLERQRDAYQRSLGLE